jgi:integrase
MAPLPKYLTQRKLSYYAVMEIPKPLRPQFLNKPRFLQSLETRDQKLATRRLPIVVARWKAEIERARGGDSPSAGIMWEMMEWRKSIGQTGDEDTKEALEGAATQWLEGLETVKGVLAAEEAAGVIFNNVQPLLPNLDAWAATITHLDPKTQSLQKLAVTGLCDYFKTTAKIARDSVKGYLLHLRTDKGLSDKTITIRLSAMRSFIHHLDESYGSDLLPLFTSKAVPKNSSAKTAKQRAWIPFHAEVVSRLYEAALGKKKPDQALADVIAFGAYTGCRIEELAQLKAEHFGESSFKVMDSKTAARIREIPLHPALQPLFKRLKENSEDGYLLDGSDEGSFGKRSDALGKRFGKLKTALGFGPQHVFHSIRKTVVSQLEQAGVNENTTADIVGHDKPRITYGLYSSGASMKQKAEALAHIAYPGLLGTVT